jgi:hypothetical protein
MIFRWVDFKNKIRLNYWFAIMFVVMTAYIQAQGKSTFNELASLNAVNKPLAEVLNDISQATGYELIIDKNWASLPITVKFNALPLDQALKRILANVNHAIVYRSDGRVLISIYEKSADLFNQPGASTINWYHPQTISQPPEIDNSLSPNPLPTPSGDTPDEPEETPPSPEEPDGESEEEKAETENTDEDIAENENPEENRAENEDPDEEKADQNQQ